MDRSATKSLVAAFVSAVNRRDLRAIAALVSTDHIAIDSRGREFRGVDVCVAGYEQLFASHARYHIRIDSVTVRGAEVFLSGEVDCSDERLSGGALWRLRVSGGRIAEFQIYRETLADPEPGDRFAKAVARLLGDESGMVITPHQ